MIDKYKVIYGDSNMIYSDEISEKKSRFIAHIKKVETEEEAITFINEIKKKHYDARHNCSAFVIGSKKDLIRSNDDGEPSRTAGYPMLEVLLGSDVVNICAVVTRYFGGTLLGTGGLIRAYTKATQAALAKCTIATMCLGKKGIIHTDYTTIGKILYELGQRNIPQDNSDYGEVIAITVTIPIEDYEEFDKKITEISAGKSFVEAIEDVYFEKIN